MFYRFKQSLLLIVLLPIIAWGLALPVSEVAKPDEDLPELSEVEWLLNHPKPGVIFTVREYDEEALKWTSERASYYIDLLRKAHPKLPIAFLAHGDEVGSLKKDHDEKYQRMHERIQHWIKAYDISFHVCGSMANMLGLSNNSFPDYIDVVPYGPSQVQDYVDLGYAHIELELTW